MARKRKAKPSTNRGAGPTKKRKAKPSTDIWDVEPHTVRFIQPYAARKEYLCPGCNQVIPPGLGHYVVVPDRMPDDRRHWHRGCWDRRAARRTD